MNSIDGQRTLKTTQPGAIAAPAPAGSGPGNTAAGSRLGRPGTPAGLLVANYVMCHVRLRDVSRNLGEGRQ